MNDTRIRIGNATLINGDCRDLPHDHFDVVVTDPMWPNARSCGVPGSEDPIGLFKAVAPHLRHAKRCVIQLGCDSDPAMLSALEMPFLRVSWLEYVLPSYRGRLLNTGDVAYCFGEWPPSRPGQRVVPGFFRSTRPDKEFARGHGMKRLGGHEKLRHPMPRRLEIVKWLVDVWSAEGETVFDPFMGSGTTGVACAQLGRRFVGIEVVPEYFEFARERIQTAYRQGDLFHEDAHPSGGGTLS